jgi:hypothetical protein
MHSAVYLDESRHSLDFEKGTASLCFSPKSAATRFSKKVIQNACIRDFRVSGRSICIEMPRQKMGLRLHIDDTSVVTPNTAGHTETCR